MESCVQIDANPDVSGVGVRLSVYITILTIAIIPRHFDGAQELVGTLKLNAGFNGLALLIAAIQQTVAKTLTLYHAILILHMLSCLGIATKPGGDYKPSTYRLAVLQFTSFLSIISFISWSIYVWSTSPTFGSQVACNHSTKYVIMFVSVRPTVDWLRWSVVANAALSLLSLLLFPLYVWLRVTKENFVGSILEKVLHPLMLTPVGVVREIIPVDPGEWMVVRFLLAAYGVVMLELTVDRNDVAPGEGMWSFGQIFAILVVLSSLNEVSQWLLGMFYKPLSITPRVTRRPSSQFTINTYFTAPMSAMGSSVSIAHPHGPTGSDRPYTVYERLYGPRRRVDTASHA